MHEKARSVDERGLPCLTGNMWQLWLAVCCVRARCKFIYFCSLFYKIFFNAAHRVLPICADL